MMLWASEKLALYTKEVECHSEFISESQLLDSETSFPKESRLYQK
jgi:hypothetical protein